MLEFVNSGLYFVQDENNVINPLLQVGSGSGDKSTGSGGPKINGSIRIPGSSSLVLSIFVFYVEDGSQPPVINTTVQDPLKRLL